MLFFVMFAVVFNIAVIVDDINAAGNAGKCRNAAQHSWVLRPMKQFAGKEKGKEYEKIFCPIAWTEQLQVLQGENNLTCPRKSSYSAAKFTVPVGDVEGDAKFMREI